MSNNNVKYWYVFFLGEIWHAFDYGIGTVSCFFTLDTLHCHCESWEDFVMMVIKRFHLVCQTLSVTIAQMKVLYLEKLSTSGSKEGGGWSELSVCIFASANQAAQNSQLCLGSSILDEDKYVILGNRTKITTTKPLWHSRTKINLT